MSLFKLKPLHATLEEACSKAGEQEWESCLMRKETQNGQGQSPCGAGGGSSPILAPYLLSFYGYRVGWGITTANFLLGSPATTKTRREVETIAG
ncbi:hypothetical protein ES703_72246 [subsurface metagenome]